MLIKIMKFVISITVFIVIIGVTIYAYMAFKGLESEPIKHVKESTNMKEYKYFERKVFVVEPKEGVTSDKTIVYFHGGSYVGPITIQYWDFINNLVNDTGMRVIIPDYPLVPKYYYQDVFNMVEPLYKEIIKRIDVDKLIVLGDSAGGGLALALEEKLSEQSVDLPSKTILISPWLDISMENSQIDEYQLNDHQLSKETLEVAGKAYAKDTDTKNYLVSPLYGDLSKLKNLIIYTGTYDILNPDVHVLKEKAFTQGVNIQIKEYEEATHIWIIKQEKDDTLWESAYLNFLSELKNNS